MLRNRSTIDIVVILLTLTLSIVLFLATIGIIAGRLINPNLDMKSGAEALSNIVTTLVGALVGFIGGRATGKLEANGTKQNDETEIPIK